MTDPIAIRPLAAEDAPQLTACFERCYGETYVAGFFYDPSAIHARIADGRLQSVVAVTSEREIVGHMALTTRHPDALTVEAGNTVVDPRYRGHGLAARMGAALIDSCRRRGYIGFHHYPTTAHPIMQKLAVQGGGIETGVMLAYVPAGTDYKDLSGMSAQGRLAVVTVYQPILAAPAREVFLPPRFQSMLCAMYDRARLARRTLAPAAAFAFSHTRVRPDFDSRRGLLHIDVEALGTDVSDRVRDATHSYSADVTHVDLALSDPAVPLAVEALRAAGVFFCALLPEFAGGDVLRLQHLRDTSEPRTIPDLVHAEARAILTAALSDRDAARADGASGRFE